MGDSINDSKNNLNSTMEDIMSHIGQQQPSIASLLSCELNIWHTGTRNSNVLFRQDTLLEKLHR